MSEEVVLFSKVCKMASRFFGDLHELFSEHQQRANGAKHKSKEADKQEAKDRKLKASLPTTAAPKKSKKKKVTSDSDIKKPLTAYMIFNNFRRPSLRTENPTFTLPDIAKLIGEEWKNLNDE